MLLFIHLYENSMYYSNLFNNTWAESSEILGMHGLWWNITSSVKMRNTGLQLSFVFLPSSNFSVSVISFVTVDKEMF